jgi:hypothetical protein
MDAFELMSLIAAHDRASQLYREFLRVHLTILVFFAPAETPQA